MAETTLQQHLEKAYALAYKAQRLTRIEGHDGIRSRGLQLHMSRRSGSSHYQ